MELNELQQQRLAKLDRLRAAGFVLPADQFPSHPTGIISASKAGYDAEWLVTQLGAQGIIAAARLGRVRLAPHIYLLESQLDQVADALGRLTPG